MSEDSSGTRACARGEQDSIDVYTDGACSGNPGPGGWGALLRWRDHAKEIYGGEARTTNNRMEMLAAITALEHLKRGARAAAHRQPLSEGRHHPVDQALASQRLARRAQAGQERGPVAAADGGDRASRRRMALVRPFRPP